MSCLYIVTKLESWKIVLRTTGKKSHNFCANSNRIGSLNRQCFIIYLFSLHDKFQSKHAFQFGTPVVIDYFFLK